MYLLDGKSSPLHRLAYGLVDTVFSASVSGESSNSGVGSRAKSNTMTLFLLVGCGQIGTIQVAHPCIADNFG